MARVQPRTFLHLAKHYRHAHHARAFSHRYRLQNEGKRRAVTIVNDTGRVPWQDLTAGEKTARAAQQGFNLGVILLGAAATVGVVVVMWFEVFSSNSRTAIFDRAADRVRKDPKCLELLAGEGHHTKRDIKAYGEPSWSRWARNRRIASTLEKDRLGTEHLRMHFYVEGPAARGTVHLHMARRQGDAEFAYRMLALDVPGHQRYYLIDEDSEKSGPSANSFLGIKWR